MIITLAGLATLLLFTCIGYYRGLLRMACLFGSLLVAGILARYFGPSVEGLLEGSALAPLALRPLVAQCCVGLVSFILLNWALGWWLNRREHKRLEEGLPRQERTDRLGGAALGFLWGGLVVFVVLAGLHLLGSVEGALDGDRKAVLSVPLQTQVPMRAALNTTAEYSEQSHKPVFAPIKAHIDDSPLASMLTGFNPLEERITRVFADLTTVAANPELMERFRHHPQIIRLLLRPELVAVSQDQDVRQALEERRYYDLLDHPKVAALLQSEPLVAECRNLDLEKVLDQVLRGPKPGE